MSTVGFPAPCLAGLLLTLGVPLIASADPSLPESALVGQNAQYQQGFRDGFSEAIKMTSGGASNVRRPSHDRTIRIESAVYGSQFAVCNFTTRLAEMADGKNQFRLSAGNDWCGNPSRGNYKVARIRYSCGRHDRRNLEVREGQSTDLQCH
ncbi:MAG TPA: hypothetical protein VES73_00410 [Lamprocystis sp. (in: g-proteobacteria)]|nr:hypothetical protein [Lamprocystis sp. (in: g-proteobacteria)]